MLKLITTVMTLVIVFFSGGDSLLPREGRMQKPPRAEITAEADGENEGIMTLPELYEGEAEEPVPYEIQK